MLRAACPDLPVGRKILPHVLRINREGGGPLPCSRAGRDGGLDRGPALEALPGGRIWVDSEGRAEVFLDVLAVTCDGKRGSETAPRFGSEQLER